jgi:hypothetical protein
MTLCAQVSPLQRTGIYLVILIIKQVLTIICGSLAGFAFLTRQPLAHYTKQAQRSFCRLLSSQLYI